MQMVPILLLPTTLITFYKKHSAGYISLVLSQSFLTLKCKYKNGVLLQFLFIVHQRCFQILLKKCKDMSIQTVNSKKATLV
jgi:hypothetical protein